MDHSFVCADESKALGGSPVLLRSYQTGSAPVSDSMLVLTSNALQDKISSVIEELLFERRIPEKKKKVNTLLN